MKRFATTIRSLALTALCFSNAFAGYNIESHGTSSAGIFTRLIRFMQDCVDLLDGPAAIWMVIAGLFIAGCLWIFAPDNRHLGKAMKAVAVGFVLFDVGLLLNYMRS